MAQHQAVSRLVRMQYSVNEALEQVQRIDEQISVLEKLLSSNDLKKQVGIMELANLKDEFQSQSRGLAPLNINRQISRVMKQLVNYTGRPTKVQAECIENLDRQLNEVLGKLRNILKEDLTELNANLATAGIPHIIIK